MKRYYFTWLILFLLIVSFLLFGFFRNSEDYWYASHPHFLVARNSIIDLGNYEWFIPKATYYGFSLNNDNTHYLLSGNMLWSGELVSFWILGEFENRFGKKIYRHYIDEIEGHKFTSTLHSDQEVKMTNIPLHLLLKPTSQDFSNEGTICRLFEINKRCFAMGKLKRWIFIAQNRWKALNGLLIEIK